VSASQSFTVKGGVLVFGKSPNEITFYFTIVGGENADFCFSGVELRYRGQMGSIVYVTGGKVRFDNVKMNKQNSVHWMNPLIDVNSTVLTVDVYILSTNISNSNYHYANTSQNLYKSGVVFFDNTYQQVITLNMSGCYFLNNSFYLSEMDSYSRGGVCRFNGLEQSGLFFIFYLFILIFKIIFT
jgi:hypothetical protein